MMNNKNEVLTEIKNSLPNKHIFVIAGPQNSGKTSLVREVYYKLIAKDFAIDTSFKSSNNSDPSKKQDFTTVIKHPESELTIGIASEGKKILPTYNAIKELMDAEVDLIICACRSKYSKAINAITELSYYLFAHDLDEKETTHSNPYNPIWFKMTRGEELDKTLLEEKLKSYADQVITHLHL